MHLHAIPPHKVQKSPPLNVQSYRQNRREGYREEGLSEQVSGWLSLLTATFFVSKLLEGHRPQQPPRCVCVGHRGEVATGLARRCGQGRQR